MATTASVTTTQRYEWGLVGFDFGFVYPFPVAATWEWDSTSGNWNTGARWDEGVEPKRYSRCGVRQSGTYTVTVNTTTATASSLTVTGANATVAISSGQILSLV